MENSEYMNYRSADGNLQRRPDGTNGENDDPRKEEQVVNEGFSGANVRDITKRNSENKNSSTPDFVERKDNESNGTDQEFNGAEEGKNYDLNQEDDLLNTEENR